jgi:hypothetical protein
VVPTAASLVVFWRRPTRGAERHDRRAVCRLISDGLHSPGGGNNARDQAHGALFDGGTHGRASEGARSFAAGIRTTAPVARCGCHYRSLRKRKRQRVEGIQQPRAVYAAGFDQVPDEVNAAPLGVSPAAENSGASSW